MEFFHTHISKNATDYVKKIFDSTFISAGKLAEQFEFELTERFGFINPVTLNSGTSALHLGLIVAGIKPGDEVIVPAQTFIATGLAPLMCGAKPVFADIQIETGNIDPVSFRKKITEKTKAVIPVHWAGYPCDMDEINEIAKENNIKVLEDAAHALGAFYKGKPIGAVSQFSAFSFQAIKHLTTGDGGALCCLKQEDAEFAKAQRWFGIDRDRSKPSILGEREYDVTNLGYKYHLNDYAAALGLANINDVPEILARRKKIAQTYQAKLAGIDGLTLLKYKNDREPAWWLFTILVEQRENFIKALKAQNIPASVVHLRIDNNSIFGGITPGLKNQELFNLNQISIPIHNGLTDEEVERIIGTIKTGW